MAPLSEKAEDTLWCAARSPSFRVGASWQNLCIYLEARDVDSKERTEEEWMKEFKKIQGRILRLQSTAENLSPPASLSESGEFKQFEFTENWWERDNRPQSVVALVKNSDNYPDGEAPLLCHFAEEEEEHYIREVIDERLALPKDSEGKVNITFYPKGGGKTIMIKCGVRSDGIADLVFATKVFEEAQRGHSDDKSETSDEGHRDLSQTREASERLQAFSDPDALARTFERLLINPALQDLDDDGFKNMGRRARLLFEGASSVRPP